MRRCLGCGTLIAYGSRCRDCRTERNRAASAARGGRNAWQSTTRRIRARDGQRCTRCGATAHLEVDHITPLAQGGTNADTNLRTLCRRCHGHRRDEHDRMDVSNV